MPGLQTVRSEQLNSMLEPLIRQKSQLLVTYGTPRGWRTFKSSFVSHSRTNNSIVIRSGPWGDGDPEMRPKAGEPLTLTCRRGHKKCMFSCILESAEPGAAGGGLLVRWPERACELQRRLCERVQLPSSMVVPVRLWIDPGLGTDGSSSRVTRHGQIEDLSVGGARIKVACADDFEVGRLYRCAFTPERREPAVVADALLRHREAADQGRGAIGFQFVGLECTVEGRRAIDTLARTVRRLQRTRSRRPR